MVENQWTAINAQEEVSAGSPVIDECGSTHIAEGKCLAAGANNVETTKKVVNARQPRNWQTASQSTK